ncbi:MAG TPA: pyridoxal-phosphate dependent enzyme [Woeseiaceae bacterium]|nr:pyridoxal-phosphate dependent enzyme [Woeseiaceae bacterium]
MSESARSVIDDIRNTLGKETLADLPTPVRRYPAKLAGRAFEIFVKHDDRTGKTYGGNKLRKLEYLLHRTRVRHRRLIGTFGTVASNHALATAICSERLGVPCVCFLSHQRITPRAGPILNMHARIGTTIVPFSGDYPARLRILRKNLWGREAGVIPAGGSSWLGAVGYVEAGVELAAQVAGGTCPPPDRVYVAAGTMGTAVGLALGFALAGLTSEIHAVRVSHTWLCNETSLRRLTVKTARMLCDRLPRFPDDLWRRVHLHLRHEFFAGGYAATDQATERAVRFADDELGLALEGTYTGKAMAALIADLGGSDGRERILFWNTCNARPLPVPSGAPLDPGRLPAEFLRYFRGVG